jgi:hypothetical protein
MKWGEKRYNNIDYQLKKHFGEKVFKVSIDAGFTCPNRDGYLSREGCIFCSEKGSGEFAGDRRESITNQIDSQIEFLKKGKDRKYIAYFQNFTNTYSDVIYLRRVYEEALRHHNIVGLAIATRSDCLGEEVLDLLSELNKKTFLWIEIGVQSTNDESAKFINRGYKFKIFEDVQKKLYNRNIKVVAHVIAGLPCEEKDEIFITIKKLNELYIWGIKIHMLYIVKNTRLYKYYTDNPFNFFTREEYIELVVDLIGYLNKNIVIHRLTGDGEAEMLIEPKWTLDKRKVLNGINSVMKKKDIWQGKFLEEDSKLWI